MVKWRPSLSWVTPGDRDATSGHPSCSSIWESSRALSCCGGSPLPGLSERPTTTLCSRRGICECLGTGMPEHPDCVDDTFHLWSFTVPVFAGDVAHSAIGSLPAYTFLLHSTRPGSRRPSHSGSVRLSEIAPARSLDIDTCGASTRQAITARVSRDTTRNERRTHRNSTPLSLE